MLEELVSVFLSRKKCKLLQHLEELLGFRRGENPGLFSTRIFNRGAGRWFLESLGGALRGGCGVLLLLINVLNQQGVHDFPLPVLPGCQLRIIQQLVNHCQVVFFTL